MQVCLPLNQYVILEELTYGKAGRSNVVFYVNSVNDTPTALGFYDGKSKQLSIPSREKWGEVTENILKAQPNQPAK